MLQLQSWIFKRLFQSRLYLPIRLLFRFIIVIIAIPLDVGFRLSQIEILSNTLKQNNEYFVNNGLQTCDSFSSLCLCSMSIFEAEILSIFLSNIYICAPSQILTVLFPPNYWLTPNLQQYKNPAIGKHAFKYKYKAIGKHGHS